MNGDDCISPHEHHLWQIHQHILLNWGIYTMFQWRRMHVPNMVDEYIFWFVPRDAPNCFEITKWLEHELGQFEREPHHDGEFPFPGCQVKVNVMEFSGIMPYLDRDSSEEMAKQAVEIFKKHLSRSRK